MLRTWRLYLEILGVLVGLFLMVYIFFEKPMNCAKYVMPHHPLENHLGKILDEFDRSQDSLAFATSVRNLHHIIKKQSSNEVCHSNLVCDEVYRGNLASLPWHEEAWILDTNCTKKVQLIITVLLLLDNYTKKVVADFQSQYPQLRIIVGVLDGQREADLDPFNNVTILLLSSTRINPWYELMRNVKTPYVFVGHKIRILPDGWGNLERSIRIINEKVGAVGGSTKNASGHWRSHCWQANIHGYNLILTPGYIESQCDCQVCSMLWDNFGPFVTKTEDILYNLDPDYLDDSIMFVDYFLKLDNQGKKTYSCPDLLYHTKMDSPSPLEWQWRKLAIEWKLQGISIDLGPMKVFSFSCQEVGLHCSPGTQTRSSLVPWCCMFAANHIIKTLIDISRETGLHFELDSGSLLGAIKLNNFIPWDVDGDIYIRSEDMHFFHSGGVGRYILEQEGISIYAWNEDNYWDKGAGHYQLKYNGLEFELMGKRGNLTMKNDRLPTLVQFGDNWAPSHHHPGQYLRGRYGPNYLRHAQSWQFSKSMENSFDSYQSGKWASTKCLDHACLSRYPTDGNIFWLPHRFP